MIRALIIEVSSGDKYTFNIPLQKGDENRYLNELTQKEWLVFQATNEHVRINSRYVVQIILCRDEKG